MKEIEPEIQILGVDGDYVDRGKLLIKEEEFLPYDLSKKLDMEKTFDLAISFEVAEHLDEATADIFVDNLVKLSDKIVFSAAVPMQGGTHHVNEQWMSYWKKKFEERGYQASYYFRNLFWDNEEILPIRRQNIMYYMKDRTDNEKKDIAYEITKKVSCDVIHPDLWNERNHLYKQQIEYLKSDNEWQHKLLDCFLQNDFEELKRDFSQMNIFGLADNLDIINYI